MLEMADRSMQPMMFTVQWDCPNWMLSHLKQDEEYSVVRQKRGWVLVDNDMCMQTSPAIQQNNIFN
jgi:hypothetical protein